MSNIMNNNLNHRQQMRPIIMKNNMPSQAVHQQMRPIIMNNNMPFQVKQPHNPLVAIKSKNLAFISTQPDNTYFHWQVEVYMHQFSKFGIADNCYILFAYPGNEPSEGAKNLKKMYKNVYWYKDERVDKSYIPTIRPHLLAKFFKEYPHLAKNFFYHDADIIFTKLPDFSLMLNDNISYLSDTIGYIGYKYIMDCCKRYKDKYPELASDDLFIGMCKAVNIDPKLVIANQDNSGGAQLLLKNTNWQFWDECEKSCNKLYKYLCEYEKKYPIPHHIQKWTAEMWAILWDFWKMGGVTKIHTQLDFSWATDTMDQYNSKNIFHLAGVTEDTCKERFFKSRYTNRDVIEEYIKDNSIFDNIIPTSATYAYSRIIIECAKQRGFRIDNPNNKSNTTIAINLVPQKEIKSQNNPIVPVNKRQYTNKDNIKPIRACELARNTPPQNNMTTIDPIIERKNRLEKKLAEQLAKEASEREHEKKIDNNFIKDRHFPFGHRGYRSFQTREKTVKQIEEPVQEIEEPVQQIEEPVQQIEEPIQEIEEPIQDSDLDKLSQTDISRLDYFQRRKMAFALLNNIPLKDVLNDNIEPPNIQPEKDIFSKFIYIGSSDVSNTVENNLEQQIEQIDDTPVHIPEKDIFSKFIHIGSNDVSNTCQNNLEEEIDDALVNIPEQIQEMSNFRANNLPDITEAPKPIIKLVINGEHYCANTYIIDEEVTCCKKNIWRSIDKKLIIFFNGSIWIITYAYCEKEIAPESGGVASNLSSDLFLNKWNFDCTVNVIKDFL